VITLDLTGVSDLAGNAGTGSITSNAYAIDTIAPTIAVSADLSSLASGAVATITFTLSDAANDFDATDVTVSGGTLGSLSGSGAMYTVSFTPDSDSTTDAVISVVSGSFSDAAGNTNADGADADNRVTLGVDTLSPSISGAFGDAVTVDEGQTAVVQFAADEVVRWSLTGGADDALFDLDAVNGTLSFGVAPFHEEPQDSDRNNLYVVVASATDTAGNMSSQTLTVTVRDLYTAMPGTVSEGSQDDDGDGIDDTLESPTADRDGDGIPDAVDYDPQGYFYCEDDGQILSGGGISISGPLGTNSTVGTRNGIRIVKDGTSGEYQWFVLEPGTYTMAVTYPAGLGSPSATHLPSGRLDVTTLLPQNPASIGSSEFRSSGQLSDYSQAANPTYHFVFDIDEGDPNVIGNNIPIGNCGANTVAVTGAESSEEPQSGESRSLAFHLTMARPSEVETIVSYALTGSATAGLDYVAPTGQVSFAAGSTTALVTIDLLADSLQEASETVILTLTSLSAGDRMTDLALAPRNTATAAIGGGIVAQIEGALQDVLAEDLARTVAEQQDRFDAIAKEALGRLKDGQDAVACGTVEDSAIHGQLAVTEGDVASSGTFGQRVNDCNQNITRITRGSFEVSTVTGSGTSATVNVDYLREHFADKDTLQGRFFGGYLRQSGVTSGSTTGTILGFGLNAGVYGARRLNETLYLDYYGALSSGYHRFDLNFPTEEISAIGGYGYGAIMGGAALSGEVMLNETKLTPRLGIDVAFATASAARLSAVQFGFSETGRVSVPDYRGGHIYGELIFGRDLGTDPWTQLQTQIDLAPRVSCGVLGSQQTCSVGGYIEVIQENPGSGTKFVAHLDFEHSHNQDKLALSLERKRGLKKGLGTISSGLSVSSKNDLTLSHKLDLKF
jgi:hypothetical protein